MDRGRKKIKEDLQKKLRIAKREAASLIVFLVGASAFAYELFLHFTGQSSVYVPLQSLLLVMWGLVVIGLGGGYYAIRSLNRVKPNSKRDDRKNPSDSTDRKYN